jgi:uncharacterized protein (TIGR02145 family)
MAMEEALGGKGVAGKAMKASAYDQPTWNGSNASGFSGLPAGYRDLYGSFYSLGNFGYWWSSSPNGGNALFRYLYSGNSSVFRYFYNPHFGFSVRCVRD